MIFEIIIVLSLDLIVNCNDRMSLQGGIRYDQDAMFSIEEIKEILEKNDYMQMQELIKRTQDKLNESVGNYNAAKEYGISEEYYRSIIEEMNTQYEQALSDHNYTDFRFAELDSNSTESKVISPVQEGKNSIVFNENGWKHTADILKRIPE